MTYEASSKSSPSISRRSFLTIASLGIVAGTANHGFAGKAGRQVNKAWDALSMLVWDRFGAPEDRKDYKVDRMLRSAMELQALGKEAACNVLLSFTRNLCVDPRNHWYWEDALIGLIRMVFLKRVDGEFRRAMIGAPGFLGRTGFDDWPLEPIEIVDGVPFCIVNGYNLGGFPEPAAMYLEYCVEHCDWNPHKYEMKSMAQKHEALNKLLALPKFKTPLSNWEKEWLLDQIR